MTRPPAAGPEARRHARTRVVLPVRVAGIDPDLDPRTGDSIFRFFDAQTIDISDGGLAISAFDDLARGRRVLLELSLPNGQQVALSGSVVWLEPQRQPNLPARMGVALAEQSLGLVEKSVARPDRADFAPD